VYFIKTEMILQSRERQRFSLGILGIFGYGLLLLAMVNLLCLLLPGQLANPLGKLQTMGTIIERSPILLLGMVLVFYQAKSDRHPWEKIILKILSWVALLAAVTLLLVIPVNITNGVLVYQQQDPQLNTQLVRQKDYLQQFQEKLAGVTSQDEIKAILQQQINQTVNIPDYVNIPQLKIDILQHLQNNQDTITNQASSFRGQKRSLLIRQCLKSNLEAIMSAIFCLMIWGSTGWARLSVRKKN
jgi:uncharacterized membrane protein